MSFLRFFSLALLLGSIPLNSMAQSSVWEPRDLRGYGCLSGEMTIVPQRGSITIINAANQAKASLVQAKYLDDLNTVAGSAQTETVVIGKHRLNANRISDVWILALRNGNQVYILSADSQANLKELFLRSKLDKAAGLTAEAGVKIPMYLNAWDKYPFRFYYRTWDTPKNVSSAQYDFAADFDYAAKHGLGFSMDLNESMFDYAEGMNETRWNDWAMRMLTRRNVPVVLTDWLSGTTWLYNRYRDQTQMKMTDFCGSYHSMASAYLGGMGNLSWCAVEGKKAELALVAKNLEAYANQPNVMDILEPHSETSHGNYDVFLEYGPVADRSFREYLRKTYGSIEVLSKRWYGAKEKISSWENITVPEVAAFAGYNKQAIDLKGEWKFAYEEAVGAMPKFEELENRDAGPTKPAPAEWFNPEFNDTTWPTVVSPGHDRSMFISKRPAVYRRNFELPEAYLQQHKELWLYFWDLNLVNGSQAAEKKVILFLNGKEVAHESLQHNIPHWTAVPVKNALQAGRNQLTARVPCGFLGYKIYLSPQPPHSYPDLGEELNAQWVDFTDWRRQTRIDAVRAGMETIRSVTPDKNIFCMAPNQYASGIKELCEQYGGHFHNTGYMGGFWAEDLPMLMRSSNLPFSLEPGGPASDAKIFRRMMGFYMTEGINAIHYFIHAGNILWEPEIKAYFEKIMPAIKMLGASHMPKAQAAMLLSDWQETLASYPWERDYNLMLPGGYFSWKYNESMLDKYQFDAVTENDLSNGNADAYRMLVDTNTTIMTEKTVDAIEKWVRNGGVFVTFIQTGRHTPTRKNAWPISRISGYDVTAVSSYNQQAEPNRWSKLNFAPGQTVFDPEKWNLSNAKAAGLTLKQREGNCANLLLWEDGGVAAGMRPLGKGYVITLGPNFCRNVIWNGWRDQAVKMIEQVMAHFKIEQVPGYPSNPDQVLVRHTVSNNGFYDLWILWNRNETQAAVTDLIFRDGKSPTACRDLFTNEVMPVKDGKITALQIPPLEIRVLVSSRRDSINAAGDWFNLQRNWWRGTAKSPLKIPETKNQDTLELGDNWRCREVADGEDVKSMILPGYDDSKWTMRNLGPLAFPEEIKSRHLLFRKSFTIPSDWQQGDIRLFLRSWYAKTHDGKMSIYIDGKEFMTPSNDNGIVGRRVNQSMQAGKTYLLAVEIDGKGQICGPRGTLFLSHTPVPAAKQDIGGLWQAGNDMLNYASQTKLPGNWNQWSARRMVKIDATHLQQQVYLRMTADPAIIGVLINGHWLRRHHHMLGEVTFLNLTPWIKFGQDNEIEVVRWNGPGRGWIDEISLYYY